MYVCAMYECLHGYVLGSVHVVWVFHTHNTVKVRISATFDNIAGNKNCKRLKCINWRNCVKKSSVKSDHPSVKYSSKCNAGTGNRKYS